MPQAPTAHGLRRPAATDKLRDGWDAIADLADDVDTWLPLLKVKTADETVTNSIAVQDDNELWLDLPVGTHEVDVILAPSAAAVGPDIRLAYSTTGTMSAHIRGRLGLETAATTTTAAQMTASSSTSLVAAQAYGLTTGGGFVWERILVVVTVAGRLRLQWAQNTVDAVNGTTVRTGSYMRSKRVA